MPQSLRLVWLSIVLILVALASRAQDAWTPVSQSVTTRDLWSIAYGSWTLVAVGDQGTVIRYDYTNPGWSPAQSGVGVWLVGIGFGNGRFVAVGDQGTILTSDDAGVTWTPRTSGVTTRLNAAVYGAGRWLVVGEQGTVLTSTDGAAWTAEPSLGSGFLRGLAFGQNLFLVGGAGGALFSSSDGIHFAPVSIATTANIEGIAISANRFWLSGSSGFLASATQLTSWSVAQGLSTVTFRGVAARSTDEAVAVGDHAAYVFSGGAWNPVSPYPVFLATAAAQGENEMVAVGLGGGMANAGTSGGPAISADSPNPIYGSAVTLRLTNWPGSAGSQVQWVHDDGAIPGATQTTLVLPQVTAADSGRYSIRTTSNGRSVDSFDYALTVVPGGRPNVVDPNFVSALPSAPSVVVPQPDGKILVAGSFSVTYPTGATYGIARLNADGSLDSTFQPGSGIPTDQSVYELLLAPNGTIYVYGSFATIDGVTRWGLARLMPNGALDTSFAPASGSWNSVWAVTSSSQLLVGPDVNRLTASGASDPTFSRIDGQFIAVDPTGRIYARNGASIVSRFLADGTRDPSYSGSLVPNFLFIGNSVAGTNGLYITSLNYTKGGFLASYLHDFPDGTWDVPYSSATTPGYMGYLFNYPYASLFQSDGSLWEDTGSVTFSAIKFDPRGNRDSTVYADLPDQTFFRIEAVAGDGSLFGVPSVSASDLAVGRAGTLIRVKPITGTPGRLSNLSVRAFVGSDPLIAGVITSGSGSTTALFRAIGPGLSGYGVTDGIRDPQLSVVRDGTSVASNDDWDSSLTPVFTQTGAFSLPPGSRDAAVETTVTPGGYTAVLTPKAGDSGTALVELYQVSDPIAATTQFINVSARGSVDAAHPLIVGFAITGDVPITVLIRGAGPALGVAPFNLPAVLPDPQITLYRSSTALWDSHGGSTDATAASKKVGAFAFPSNSADSAMVVTLPPGNYTAVVGSVSGKSGTALAEVYQVLP